MAWRRPSPPAADDSWTTEGFEALQDLDRSRRRVLIGLVGSPAAAWLWADTIALSRAFEVGGTSPPRGGSSLGRRHERGVRRRWLSDAFAPRDVIGDASLGRDGSWALTAFVEPVRLGWRLLPLTAFLAWMALAR